MDCGIPFCHSGCPLGNLIPDWNDLVYRGRWRDASDRLHATNNFPDFYRTPLSCAVRSVLVLAINDEAVAVKSIERAIADAHSKKDGSDRAGPPRGPGGPSRSSVPVQPALPLPTS